MSSKRNLDKWAGRLMKAREQTKVARDRLIDLANMKDKRPLAWTAEMKRKTISDLHTVMDELASICNSLEDGE
jgi:hypothetical protein